jgi:cobalt-precorrin 5A hydrolase / precorrin-3B C17-methyltransferase
MSAPAIVILGQSSVAVARKVEQALPGALLYGLKDRTSPADIDISYPRFGELLRELFAENRPIVGICAAGILIRTLAPLLTSKWKEPPVLAIAEDGSAVVPLLGGLHGVNDLARQIAAVLDVAPAITTTGDLRFRTALLHPPRGYSLVNPEVAKTFLADLLSGQTVRLVGSAPWIEASLLPIDDQGLLILEITERCIPQDEITDSNRLIYCPQTVILGFSASLSQNPSEAISFAHQALAQANLAPAAVAGVFGQTSIAAHPGLHAVANALGVPARFVEAPEIKVPEIEVSESRLPLAAAIVMKAAESATLVAATPDYAIAISPQPLEAETLGQAQGKLFIIGTGPGSAEWMSPEVKQILQSTTDWVGYSTYLNLVEPLRTAQCRHDSDNREELDRARLALDLAASGRSVAVISSGDPGIFAMAAAVFEALDQTPRPEWAQIAVQVAPGISAFQAAAARVGAPVGHDFCVLSLSDILKPWSTIERRLRAAAEADFVIALYNPVSTQRTQQLIVARDLLLQTRSPDTPVVLARNLGRPGESITLRTLQQLSPDEVDMRTLILVGSSKTRSLSLLGQNWIYTPRRYDEALD